VLIAHIPPGIDLLSYKQSCIVPHTNGLIKLVEDYQDVLIAQFYGHVHRDFFKYVIQCLVNVVVVITN